jgi:hypothetical protein
MDEHANEVPFFDETYYSAWRINMKGYLNSKGSGVWNTVVGGSVPSKNHSKGASQKEAKKKNGVVFKTILNGLSYFPKERIGPHSSAKDLWMKLEKVYQDKRKDTEDNSIKDNEGKYSPKSFDCNNSKCDDVECFHTNEEEDLEVVCVESSDNYLIDKEEELLLNHEDKVFYYLEKVERDDYAFKDLEDYIKETKKSTK